MSISIWKSAARASVASSTRESYALLQVRGSLALCLLLIAGNAVAGSILFIGNSFTYAQGSPVRFYRSDTVTDLNHQQIGGVPALFKSFTVQAGLRYDRARPVRAIEELPMASQSLCESCGMVPQWTNPLRRVCATSGTPSNRDSRIRALKG
jgi:hypothetical protein